VADAQPLARPATQTQPVELTDVPDPGDTLEPPKEPQPTQRRGRRGQVINVPVPAEKWNDYAQSTYRYQQRLAGSAVGPEQQADNAETADTLRQSRVLTERDENGNLVPQRDENGNVIYKTGKGPVTYDQQGQAQQTQYTPSGPKQVQPDANAPIGTHSDYPNHLFKQNKYSPWESLGTIDEGLKSKDPNIQAAAQEAKLSLDKKLHAAVQETLGEHVNSAFSDVQSRVKDIQANAQQIQALQKELDGITPDKLNEKDSVGIFGVGGTLSQGAKAAQDRKAELEKQIQDLTEAGYSPAGTSVSPGSAKSDSVLNPQSRVAQELSGARQALKDAHANRAGWSEVAPKEQGDFDRVIQQREDALGARGLDPEQDPVLKALKDRKAQLGVGQEQDQEAQFRNDPNYGPLMQERDALDAAHNDVSDALNATAKAYDDRLNPARAEIQAAQAQIDPLEKVAGKLQDRVNTILGGRSIGDLTDIREKAQVQTLLNRLNPMLDEVQQRKAQLQPLIDAHDQMANERNSVVQQQFEDNEAVLAPQRDALQEKFNQVQAGAGQPTLSPELQQIAKDATSRALAEKEISKDWESGNTPDGLYHTDKDAGTVSFERGYTGPAMIKAMRDGALSPDYVKDHLADARKADDEYKALMDAAGSNPKLKAFVDTGIKSYLAFQGGAAASAAVVPFDPELAVGGASLTAPVGGWGAVALPALVHGIAFLAGTAITQKAAGALLDRASNYSDLVNSLESSAKLEPGYAAAGEIAGMGPAAVASYQGFAKAASVISEKQGAGAAVKFIATKLASGAGAGVAFEAALRPGFDAATHAIGLNPDEVHYPTFQSIAQAAAIMGILSGEGLGDTFKRAASMAANARPETADLVKESIAKAKKDGVSPEFRAFFGGIDPEVAGTTHEKVAAFAQSLGMEYKPVPKPETGATVEGSTGNAGQPENVQRPTEKQAPAARPTVDQAHQEIDNLQMEGKTPEEHAVTQDALRGLVKISQGQPMDALTAAEKKAVLSKDENGVARVEMAKGPDGSKPIITDAALARVQQIAPITAQILPKDEETQRQQTLKPESQPTFAVEVEGPKGEREIKQVQAPSEQAAQAQVAGEIQPGKGMVRDVTRVPGPTEAVQPHDFVESAVASAAAEKGGELTPAEDKQVRVVAKVLQPEYERWQKAFQGVGFTLEGQQSGGALLSTERKLVISVPDVIRHAAEYTGSPDHTSNIMTHEVTHAVTTALENRDPKTGEVRGPIDLVKIYQSLPKKIQDAMRTFYKSEGSSDYHFAHEMWAYWLAGDMQLAKGRKIRLKDKFLPEQSSRQFIVENRKALATLLRFFRDMQGQLRKSGADEDLVKQVGQAQEFIRSKVKEVDAHAQMESGKGSSETKAKSNVPTEQTARGPPGETRGEGAGAGAGEITGTRGTGRGDTGVPEVSGGAVEPASRIELAANAERSTPNAQRRTEEESEKAEVVAATKAAVKIGVRSPKSRIQEAVAASKESKIPVSAEQLLAYVLRGRFDEQSPVTKTSEVHPSVGAGATAPDNSSTRESGATGGVQAGTVPVGSGRDGGGETDRGTGAVGTAGETPNTQRPTPNVELGNSTEFKGQSIPLAGEWRTKNPRGSEVISGKWALAPIKSLTINTERGAAQDRIDRERTGAAQRLEIIQNLTPENVEIAWGASPTLNDGAPITTPDGSVEVGNNRTMAIRDMYASHPDKAAIYDKWARGEAARLGIKTDIPDGEPVALVRVTSAERGGLSQQELVKASNTAATEQRSIAETALSDRNLFSDPTLTQSLNPNEDGSFNHEFLTAFYNSVGAPKELRFEDGTPDNGKIERRAQAALLAHLLGEQPGVDRVLSSLMDNINTPGIRQVVSGLSKVGPAIVNVDTINPSLSITPNLGRALTTLLDYRRAKDSGEVRNVSDYFSQGAFDLGTAHRAVATDPLDARILELLANARSVKQVVDPLMRYVKAVVDYGDPNQQRFFGDEEPPSAAAILKAQKTTTNDTDREMLWNVAQSSATRRRTFPAYTTEELKQRVQSADEPTRSKMEAEIAARESGEAPLYTVPQITSEPVQRSLQDWAKIYRKLFSLEQSGAKLTQNQRRVLDKAESALGQKLMFGDETRGQQSVAQFKAKWTEGPIQGGEVQSQQGLFDQRGAVGRMPEGEEQGTLFSQRLRSRFANREFPGQLNLFDRLDAGEQRNAVALAERNTGGESNAIQKPETGGVLQHPQEGVGETGSQRGRVEPGEQGIKVAETGETQQPASVSEELPLGVPETSPVAGSELHRASNAVIQDFGEKIGGARKDLAEKTGPKGEGKTADERPSWMRKYHVFEDARKPGEWVIGLSDGGLASRSAFQSKAEAEKAIPLLEVSRNHDVRNIARSGETDNYAIQRSLGPRKRPTVKDGFATREDAMHYMATNPEEIINHKFNFPEKPWLDHIERTGPAHRPATTSKLGDVTPRMFQSAFGFRGGEFGNWNMGSSGQAALNHAYDAMYDLAHALGVDPRALSLNGELAIAFGARGHGLEGARAHYEPDYAVINLTKIKGAGSAAHEWFHAFDHYLARQDTKAPSEKTTEGTFKVSANKAGNYVSHGFSYKTKVRAELEDAFKAVMEAMVRKNVTGEIDKSLAEKNADRMSEHVASTLKDIRRQLETYHVYSRSKKPPTSQQLQRFDTISAKIEAGDVGDRKFIESEKSRFGGRESYQAIEDLNSVYKEVLGRSFATSADHSLGKQLFWQLKSMFDAQERLAKASEGVTEVKSRPTDYFRESRKIDDFRSSDYWSTPHEMGARSFESFVHDKLSAEGRRSDYLVHGVENKFYQMFDLKPYPEGEERSVLDTAWQKVFDVIEQERTGKGVALRTQALNVLRSQPINNEGERISAAAVRLPDGQIFTGAYHDDALSAAYAAAREGKVSRRGWSEGSIPGLLEGFTTTNGRFLDRDHAYEAVQSYAGAGAGTPIREAVQTLRSQPLVTQRPEGGPSPATERFNEELPLAMRIARSFENVKGPLERDDLEQHARIALARAAESYHPDKGAFRPFAVTAVRNELRGLYDRGNRLKRIQETRSLEAPIEGRNETSKDLIPSTSDVRSEAALDEGRKVINELVTQLPERMQAALNGILEGKSIREIADGIGVSPQAVSKLATTAMERMRRKLGEVGITKVSDLLSQPISKDERIEKVAVKLPNGRVVTSLGTHADALVDAIPDSTARFVISQDDRTEYGYTTSKGRFVDRDEALALTKKQGYTFTSDEGGLESGDALNVIDSYVKDELKAQSSADPLQQLIDSLNTDELENLFDKSNAEERGRYTIGRPDLAMGASEASQRAVDQYYTDLWKPKSRDQMQREAEKNPISATEVAQRWLNGDTLRDSEVMAAKTLLADLSRDTSPEGLRNMFAAGFAYRNIRGQTARDLAAGFDPHKTPEERNREFLTKVISTLPPAKEAEIEREPDKAKKRAMLDAAMKERLDQLEKAFSYISKGGVTLEDIMGGGWELHGKGKEFLENQRKNLDVPHQKALKLAIGGERTSKEIAKATGLTEKDVRDTIDQFNDQVEKELVAKVKAGLRVENMSFEGMLATQPLRAQEISDADALAEARKIMRGMGLVSAKDQGTFKVTKRKRSKIFVPPKVPRTVIESPEDVARRENAPVPYPEGQKPPYTGRVLGQPGLPLYQEMMVRKGADLGSVDDVAKIARVAQAANGNRADMIYEAGLQNLLSGPTTHITYKVGLLANSAFEFTVMRGLESLVNLMPMYQNSDAPTFKEFKYIFRGVVPSLARALRVGARQWSTESDIFDQEVLNSQSELYPGELNAEQTFHRPSISERPLQQFFGDKAKPVEDALQKNLGNWNPVRGRVIRMPTRVLWFVDGFIKTLNGMMEVTPVAYRMAKREGLSGDALTKRMNELVATPGSPAWIKAADFAKWMALREPVPFKDSKGNWVRGIKGNWIDNAVGQFAQTRSRSHAWGYFFPFVQLPYNYLKNAARGVAAPVTTPIKFTKAAKSSYDAGEGFFNWNGEKFQSNYSQPQQIRDIAKSIAALAVGAIIWRIIAGDSDDDDKHVLITGSTPYTQLKKGVRELQQRAYGGPYVIRIGGRNGVNFNYGKYEPAATILGTVADTLINTKHLLKGELGPREAVDALAGYLLAQTDEKSFLMNLDGLSKMFSGETPVTQAVPHLFLNWLVPNLIRQPLRNYDDFVPDAKHSNLAYNLLPMPSLRQPKIDVYGNPVKKTGNWFTRMFTMAAIHPYDELKKADRLLIHWNNSHPRDQKAVTEPGTTYQDIHGKTQQMTPAQSTKYQIAAGKRFDQLLTGRFTSQQIAKPTEEDVKLIEKLHTQATEQIKREMFPKGSTPQANRVNIVKQWKQAA
jgi:RNA polymerase sigma factor (sigma-70 family)